MASVTVGENQLQRIIRDLHDAVAELSKEHMESGEPITDDSSSLHKFCYKLEYLLQYDQKAKATFLGSRKDYWDYFCDCLAKVKGTNDGIRFVKSISELKTSLGKGRAFIRYCLVHQRLADTLQQCLMNQRVTCDWYYARSPFLKSHVIVDIINHLYELNEVQFDVAPRGYDLDSEWPTFARKTLGSATHTWRPPSRCSSVNSLVSNYSQPAQEFSPDFGSNLLGDLGELGEFSCSDVDELRAELDQSELRQQNLLKEVHLLTDEAAGLRREVGDLQGKLQAAENVNQKPHKETDQSSDSFQRHEAEQANGECTGSMQPMTKEPVAMKEIEERLAELEKDRTTALQQTNELQAAVNHLEEALSLKEQEVASLQIKLQDMQKSAEEREEQADEMKRREQKGYEELHQRDSQISSLEEQLKLKETELSIRTLKLQQLENQSQSMDSQGKKLEEYKTQCSSLMEINGKLLHTIKRAEESNKELGQSKAALERELAILKSSKKMLDARPDLAQLTAEEQEKNLLEDNEHLEESIQKAQMKSEMRMLENENKLQVSVKDKHEELDVGPNTIETETGFDRHLKAVQDKEHVDKSKDLCAVQHFETRDGSSRLALAEAQLDMNMKEVSRLQEEIMELRALLHVSADEKIKIQALQEVSEASRKDLQRRCEELKAQVEELNRKHVEELLLCRERQEAIAKERDWEAHARENLQAQVASMQEQLDMLKFQDSAVVLENAESHEALYRANTDIAELGVQVCLLTRKNEELVAKVQVLEEAEKKVQALSDSAEALSKDNTRLLEELKQLEGLPKAMKELQQRLEEAQEEAKSLRKCKQREVNALRLQLAEQATQHGDKTKVLNKELLGAQSQVEAEHEKLVTLETRLAELEASNRTYCEVIEEKNATISSCETCLLQKEEHLNQTKADLSKVQEEFALAQKACQDLTENLQRIALEKETCDLKTTAEIDDLYRTKKNLEERLVELIRDKDALWQKSDALEFEQKLRAEEEVERDLPYCLGCHAQFSWWLRRHSCKLCGRPFCYSCCSNTAIAHQGGNRERCCKDCYAQHSAITERPHQEDLGGPSQPPPYPLASTPTRRSMLSVTVPQRPGPDDAVFDIITDEEVNGILHDDSLPYTTALSPGSEEQGPEMLTSNLSAEEGDGLAASAQDAELCLLMSGDLTVSVPFTVEEIAAFGEEPRELFVKSGCYSRVPITVGDGGPTIGWVFSSMPKSIALSVVYRESADTPLEQAKVLIPLTKCTSHKEPIQGQLKARNPGEYSLIFDNSFSRFISKKVLYRLSLLPVVNDGSDCL